MRIWKYDLHKAIEHIEIPWYWRVISVACQENHPGALISFWAIVDPDTNLHRRTFHVVETGRELPTEALSFGSLHYLGTGIAHQGSRVLHLFEER